MICILHGYLLDGSGSNLWTRSMVRALCREGHTVHLVCQEPHPERYDFIAEAHLCDGDTSVAVQVSREVPYPGRCILHRPLIGDTLPVYVWDEYDEFEHVVPMTELADAQLEDYLHHNLEVVLRVIRENGITVMHANHAVLMSVVAQRASFWTGVPYVVMPHGSALEYAVRPDARLRRMGAEAFAHATRVLVISDEVAARVAGLFGDVVADLDARLEKLDLGVDTAAFLPVRPSDRRSNVERVKRLLEDVPRGRSPAQESALADMLARGDTVGAATAATAGYPAKQPDEAVESKLDGVDWETAQVLAFVGRLIPAKGIHAVIGALPLMLPRAPRLRVLVVGHGPLREPLEALVHALASGDRTLAEQALTHAETIEAGEPEHLNVLRLFWRALEQERLLDEYWDSARRQVTPGTVIFAGYLTHREMSLLLPCCDVAIFPSLVPEAGPLVFLEALASGVFPIGTYFAGMKVKIDRIAPALDPQAAAAMKIRPDAPHIVSDIADAVPAALALDGAWRDTLRCVAEEHYDWQPLARRLYRLLQEVVAGTPHAT